jgi:hypothetical protein
MLLQDYLHLPEPDEGGGWDEEVYASWEILCDAFNAASEVLQEEDNSDSPIRFRTCADKISYFKSLVDALQHHHNIGEEWSNDMLAAFDEQEQALRKAEQDARDL